MANKIKCSECVFAREDKNASEKAWTAYECSNPDSEYHKALLNVTPNGEKQTGISWVGCPFGERRDVS